MRLQTIFNRQELEALQYPIVVHGWSKRLEGRVKRAWLKEFPTEAERRKCSWLHSLFYRWYLVKGTPDEYPFTLRQYELAKRLVHFFATV